MISNLDEAINIATFSTIAVVCAHRWLSNRRSAAGWLALAFAALSGVAVVQLFEEFDFVVSGSVASVAVASALLFPYLLFRFTSSLDPSPTWSIRAAGATGFGVALWTLAIPIGKGLQVDAPFAYSFIVFAYWTTLSVVSSVKVWRASFGTTPIVRKRLHFLRFGTISLNVVALLSSIAATEMMQGLLAGIGLATGIAFYLAIATPRFLRVLWRSDERQEMDIAIVELMKATTEQEVASILVPHVVALVAADFARLESSGHTLAFQGSESQRYAEPDSDSLRLPLSEDINLVVQTSPFTPYFHQDERDLLEAIAAIGRIALERIELQREEQEARAVAETANQAKTEFLSRMSHELRTPLSSILGFGQLLRSDDLDEQQSECVHYILKGGRHLLDLINEVLDVARIEAGRMTLSLEPVEVTELIEETLALMRPMAQDRGISIDVLMDPDANLHVTADRQRSKQVLINLLSNAIKYNREDGRIYVLCQDEGELIRISIIDTGAGIAPDRIDRLFTPFERLDADATSITGSGLGLALSKGLAEAMGGRIEVDSAVGEGSTFSILLRRGAGERWVQPSDGRGEIDEPAIEGAFRVLQIEDNVANQRLVERILADFGNVELMTAIQGRVGLDLARTHKPDVVLLDLHLPDVEGYEILHQLRADPTTRDTKIIVLSADASAGQIKRLKDAGADEYLTKPLDVPVFKRTLGEVLTSRTTANDRS